MIDILDIRPLAWSHYATKNSQVVISQQLIFSQQLMSCNRPLDKDLVTYKNL